MEQTLFTLQPSFKLIKLGYIIAIIIFILCLPIVLATNSALGLLFSPGLYILIIVGVRHLKRNHTIYTITSEKIKIRTGILGKAENNIPLSKIQNVATAYSFSQRIFGIGNIIIESAGGRIGDIALRDVDQPDDYAHQILEAVHKKENFGNQHTNNV